MPPFTRPLCTAAMIAVAPCLATGCGSDGTSQGPAARVVFDAPAADGVVETYSFTIAFSFEGTAIDPDSVQLRVNGFPVAVSGGPTRFNASIDAGPPLRDDNLAEAQAQADDGRLVDGSLAFR